VLWGGNADSRPILPTDFYSGAKSQKQMDWRHSAMPPYGKNESYQHSLRIQKTVDRNKCHKNISLIVWK